MNGMRDIDERSESMWEEEVKGMMLCVAYGRVIGYTWHMCGLLPRDQLGEDDCKKAIS